ncbi:MAG TPA: hypothetical protein DDW52_17075 [Planctomycetaceae bacterium]|nr:hypothetical protein [Planctomycetaceae bacterium]
MGIPDASHLQIAVLDSLSSEKSGRELRARLAKLGYKQGGPAFYRMMGRLEESKLVEGWQQLSEIDGIQIREKRYRISAEGIRCLEQVREHYSQLSCFGLTS